MTKTTIFSLCVFLCLGVSTSAQVYQDFFGAGHTIGIKAHSSDAQGGSDLEEHSIDGSLLIPDPAGASRFLAQSTLGWSQEEIDYLSQIGIKQWLDEQIALPAGSYLETFRDIYLTSYAEIAAVHGTDFNRSRKAEYFHYTFYEKAFKEPDVLRHKLAFALNQIFVMSFQSPAVAPRGYAVSSYYDLLYQNGMGNFRDLLGDISMHPAMGLYLSHFKNKKADLAAGTFPDENYAREIMQLFTIGLYELNNDGSYKTDLVGDYIPTYENTDIEELAKVFTGLGGAAYDTVFFPQYADDALIFGRGTGVWDLTIPMRMYEEHHDQGTKTLIDGTIIPAGQPGLDDIEMALDVLFNHPNVGPFLALRLIQQFVKSNPTPAFINRIATVFNDNGLGVRGDMEAVVRAVFLDPEARDCLWLDDPTAGKMVQPMERLTQLCRAFDVSTASGKFYYWDRVYAYDELEQAFFYSPSVFNFFTPFFAESINVATNDLVSPAFQILNSTSGISSMNLLEDAIKNYAFHNRTLVNPNAPSLRVDTADRAYLDFSDEVSIYENDGLDALLDHLNVLLCRGQLHPDARTIIKSSLVQYVSNLNSFTSEDVVENAVYFIVVSPSYSIMK